MQRHVPSNVFDGAAPRAIRRRIIRDERAHASEPNLHRGRSGAVCRRFRRPQSDAPRRRSSPAGRRLACRSCMASTCCSGGSTRWRALSPALPPMRRLKAQFKHFAAVDERVAVTATRTESSVILRFIAAGMTIAQLVVDFGAAGPRGGSACGEPVPAPAEAHDLSFEAMAGMSGRLAFASPPDAIAAMFPAASRLAGPAPRRRARRHHPAGRHGVSRAAFHLCRVDGRGVRGGRRGGQARLPGYGDRSARPARCR